MYIIQISVLNNEKLLAGPSVLLFPLEQAKYNTEVWNRLYVVLLG